MLCALQLFSFRLLTKCKSISYNWRDQVIMFSVLNWGVLLNSNILTPGFVLLFCFVFFLVCVCVCDDIYSDKIELNLKLIEKSFKKTKTKTKIKQKKERQFKF